MHLSLGILSHWEVCSTHSAYVLDTWSGALHMKCISAPWHRGDQPVAAVALNVAFSSYYMFIIGSGVAQLYLYGLGDVSFLANRPQWCCGNQRSYLCFYKVWAHFSSCENKRQFSEVGHQVYKWLCFFGLEKARWFRQQMTWLLKSMTMETLHWLSSNFDSVNLH